MRSCSRLSVCISGVGGSATNDGGIGLLIPLGFKFLDEKGQPIEPNGRGLAKLAEIVPPEKPIPARFIAATDVDIPLLGEHGAALQFARQKGANDSEIKELEANMKRLTEISQKCLGKSLHESPGSGSAGGCGYGLINFLGAKRVSGFELFAEYANLDKVNPGSVILSGEMMFRYLGWNEAADLIITGLENSIKAKTVTYDLARLIEGAKEVKCSEFGSAIIANM